MSHRAVPDTTHRPPVGDLGRRLVQRRTECGLTRKETADRAGVAPSYLRYLEEHHGAAPGTGVLLRLAGVLDTTLAHLTGGDVELPPGPEQADRHAEFVELSTQECRTLLSTHGVGRVAIPVEDGPVIVPVNYSVVDDLIVFRTDPGSVTSRAPGCRVAFEVDRIDDAFSTGWSVLVRGRATAVTEPDAVRRLTELAYSSPWAGGQRELWVSVRPDAMTGRRIAVDV
ncbi:helix-turn-helix domain-containing protein [Streptomyces sp. NPDC050548]|uniref:helix-turn-helix domain-containing protein n=1 Tax=Streptomyces sp. NPDC050548 TaxID=3365629 RepID=UPI0037B36C2F